MKKYLGILLCLIMTVLAAEVQAAPQIVNFTFTGLDSNSFGLTQINGTVNGQLIFADTEGELQPLSLTLSAIPASYGMSTPINFGELTVVGEFTLEGGVVIASSAVITNQAANLQVSFNRNQPGTYFYRFTPGSLTYDDDSSSTAFTSVPEPGTWALLLTGAGLAALAYRRQRS